MVVIVVAKISLKLVGVGDFIAIPRNRSKFPEILLVLYQCCGIRDIMSKILKICKSVNLKGIQKIKISGKYDILSVLGIWGEW